MSAQAVTLEWVAFLAVQTVQFERAQGPALPPPRIYLGSALAFGILAAVSGPAPGPAAAMGGALLVAAVISNRFALTPAPAGGTVTKKPSKPSAKKKAGS